MAKQVLIENVRISFNAIKGSKLRTVLTVLIIAFGIMALVGISTAIDALEKSLVENLMSMGSNTFTIQNRQSNVQIGRGPRRSQVYPPISFREAMDFKSQYAFPALVSVSTNASSIATVKYNTEKTNPNIEIIGTDENFMLTSSTELQSGRNFSEHEAFYGSHVAVIGAEIAKTLFKRNEDPQDKIISIGPGKYKVIGVVKEKGTGMGFSPDRQVLLPITNVRQYFSRPNMSFTINVLPQSSQNVDAAVGEAIGVFRVIRQNKIGDENDFDISKSDQLLEMLAENTKSIKLAALIIGFITLFGAAIGLMNIMLVSVSERTREIGIRKSLGATRLTIRNQFLAEAIIIGQLGGICGIILGVLAGNIVTFFTDTSFLIPWMWIGIGVLLCLIVALVSGILPAIKAARLDPIESLRFE
ncbi:MAG TPA: ABC transporter permease [Bacteroidales bacterium]|nr:ABC transporter permease [Bacteroidales bacterium]